MGNKIGIEIGATDQASGVLAKLHREFNSLNGSVDKSSHRLTELSSTLSSMFAAVSIGAAAAAVGALIKNSINAADEISKLSQKVGVDIEQLSAMNYAAGLANVSTEALAKGMAKLNKTMFESYNGGKSQAETFKALGISVTDADGKLRKSDEVMLDIAERFAGMDDGAKKTALAMEIFGKAGADMIPLLNEGKEGLKQAADEARRFGLVLTEEAGKQAEEFNDNLTRLEKQASGLAITLGNKVLPSINKVTDAFIKSGGVQNPLKGLAAVVATDPFLNYDQSAELEAARQKLNGSLFTAKMPPRPKGDDTGDDLVANAKAAAEAEAAFQRYSSAFDSLMLKAEALNPHLSKNQKELLAINVEIAKAITANPEYAGSIEEAGKYLRKMTENTSAFQLEMAGVIASIKELETANASLAEIGKLAGLEPSGGFLTASKPKAKKYSLTGASETMGYGGNSLKNTADAIGYTAEEAQKLSDRYQEIIMQQQEIYDSSPWLGMQKGLEEYAKSVKSIGDAYESFALKSMGGLEDAIVDSTEVGAKAFTRMIESMLRDLFRIQVQQQITGPLSSAISGGLGSLFGGDGPLDGTVSGNSFGVLLSDMNTRAAGGPVDFGQTYLVGEKGPELFTPGASGIITPNSAISRGGDISISVGPINMEDKKKASSLRTEIEDAVIKVIRRHS